MKGSEKKMFAADSEDSRTLLEFFPWLKSFFFSFLVEIVINRISRLHYIFEWLKEQDFKKTLRFISFSFDL